MFQKVFLLQTFKINNEKCSKKHPISHIKIRKITTLHYYFFKGRLIIVITTVSIYYENAEKTNVVNEL